MKKRRMRRRVTPEQVERYALTDKWDSVDRAMAFLGNEDIRKFLPAARLDLARQEGSLQDLGATIFQNYQGEIQDTDRELLLDVTRNPGNEFAKYRAGFALWKHGVRTPYVRALLKEAKKCPDVQEIATDLLKD